jgi:hypothetical protein
MKIMVTGSRGWKHKGLIHRLLTQLKPTMIVHGDCKQGADAMTDLIARRLRIPVRKYPAQWEKYGKSAGFIRNTEMIVREQPDVVVAFWDESSRGTEHAIKEAEKLGVTVMIATVDFAGQLHVKQIFPHAVLSLK